MRRVLGLAVLTWMLLAGGNAYAAERTVTLSVENMSCAACPYIVERTLAAVDGVRRVRVSYREKSAEVMFDDRRTSVAALTAATADIGFPSRLLR